MAEAALKLDPITEAQREHREYTLAHGPHNDRGANDSAECFDHVAAWWELEAQRTGYDSARARAYAANMRVRAHALREASPEHSAGGGI